MNIPEPLRLIGLTGTCCAGKNYVGRLLEDRGVPVLDVDILGHEALELEHEAITARFGSTICGPDGRINRRILGAQVFGKPAELAALESIVHPRTHQLEAAWIARQSAAGRRCCVINAALLHKCASFPQLAVIVLVNAPVLIRLIRARRRDGLPWLQLLKRFWSQRQFPVHYLTRRADIYSIQNRGGHQKQLEQRIETLLVQTGIPTPGTQPRSPEMGNYGE